MNWLLMMWWLTVYIVILAVGWQSVKMLLFEQPKQKKLKVTINPPNRFHVKQQ